MKVTEFINIQRSVIKELKQNHDVAYIALLDTIKIVMNQEPQYKEDYFKVLEDLERD